MNKKGEDLCPEFSKESIKRIFKRAGANKVSDDAKKQMCSVLNEIAKDIAHYSVKYAKNAGKATISAEDVQEATKWVLGTSKTEEV